MNETLRLHLRPITIADAETLFAWRQEERIQQFNPLDDITLEQLTAILAKTGSDLSDRTVESYRWMVVSDEGRVVGSVSFKAISWRMGHGEIGYGVAESEHGKGIGKAAVALLVDKLFAETDIHKLIAYVASENTASCRILERLNFQREGYLREHYVIQGKRVDEVLFSLLRQEHRPSLQNSGKLEAAANGASLDPDLKARLIDYLQDVHGCYSVILYGSFARGAGTVASDIDVLAIGGKGGHYRIGKMWNGRLLDAWVYDEASIPGPEKLLHLHDGVVLVEKNSIASDLLMGVRDLLEKPMPPLPHWERQQLSTWIAKMAARCNDQGVESDYRRHWLLYDLLPLWFSFQRRRFYGSKKAFAWLKENEPGLHRLFSDALASGATHEQIQHLSAAVRRAACVEIDIVIRAACVDDAKHLARLHVDSWRESYQGIMPTPFLNQLSYADRESMWNAVLSEPKPRWHAFVATTEDGEVIGFTAGGENRQPNTSPYDGELFAIYLRKEFHQTGIGKQLFYASAQQLLRDGFTSLMLWALEENPARGFYERLGGKTFATKMEAFGGKELKEIAYGWDNLATLSR